MVCAPEIHTELCKRQCGHSVDCDLQMSVSGWKTHQYRELHPSLVESAAAAIASSGATLVSHPFDLVKTRLQLSGEKRSNLAYRGFVSSFVQILKCEGMRGVYRGLLPGILFNLTINGTRFGVYHETNEQLVSMQMSNQWPISECSLFTLRAVSALTAGAASAFLASPFALVKIRLQVGGTNRCYIMRHVSAIYQENGIYGFFRGSNTAGKNSASSRFIYPT